MSAFKLHHLIIALVCAVAIARLFPHPYNFTPVGAFTLFCGAYISDKRYLLLPLAALLIGDALTGFYTLLVMIFVYLGFVASAAIGRVLLAKQRTAMRFIVAVCSGALCFYLISNIGMWWVAYPQTPSGLIACWIDGLPFLARSVTGDFVYAAIMFGIVEWYRSTQPETPFVQGVKHHRHASQ